MAKVIWKGFNPRGDMISSQPFAITGANLRKSSDDKLERQKKTGKARTRTRAKLQKPQKEEGS